MIRVLETSLFVTNVRTRLPFRYGIVTLKSCPHLFCRVEVEMDGRRASGVSADHLVPKWFTKNPATTLRGDVEEMIGVIRNACEIAREVGAAKSVFDLWLRIYRAQGEWGSQHGLPALLTGFGTSLVERAAIDAFCRANGISFGRAVRESVLGIDLGAIHQQLAGAAPSQFLPPEPIRAITVRHTVGLVDPLTDAEIEPADRVDDGLAQSLESAIRAHGLTHFKIKLCGDVNQDRDRLARIADVIARNVSGEYAFTLDGNENFKSFQPLGVLWSSIREQSSLHEFMQHLLFVEQPFHRDVALSSEIAKEMTRWQDRPAMIIDESDGSFDSLPIALNSGYVGTSHKNCKNVFKGIANACLIAHQKRQQRGAQLVISAEDLSNIGPIALLQDLAVVATLGIDHAERNGQHYFRGTSMFPGKVRENLLRAHPDLYRRHGDDFAAVSITAGRIDVGSVVDAPFGYRLDFDTRDFMSLDDWSSASLET